MFRRVIVNVTKNNSLLKPFPSAKTYCSNKLSDNIADKIESVYWVGTIPSCIIGSAYGTNKVIKKNMEMGKDNIELYFTSAVFGVASGIAGAGLWLTLPFTGPIVGGTYLYNKYFVSQ